MTLAEPALLFARFEQDAGTRGGARQYFQMLVTDLVKVQHPLATTVDGPGGRDWGIDTFVGELNGRIFVWQSKFILEWINKNPQQQVRKSFDDVITQAQDRGFAVKAWTLCVPCLLSPDQHKWFVGWAGRMKRKHGTEVRLSNGIDLRHQLLREDARYVRAEYFPHTMPVSAPDNEERLQEPLAITDDKSQFDDALFVLQLRAAGYEETDASRGLFYATEALFRDYSSKGDARSLAALEELHVDVHWIWEDAFNEALPNADQDGTMRGLINTVMKRAAERPNPADLRLRPAHKQGAAHRLVEAARAGWVRRWRSIAEQHRGAPVAAASGPDDCDRRPETRGADGPSEELVGALNPSPSRDLVASPSGDLVAGQSDERDRPNGG